MELTVQRETLLKPLQAVVGAVERRQTLPILANVLLSVRDDQLLMTGTDLEVELMGRIGLDQPVQRAGETTVSARKLLDICRALPENAAVKLLLDKDRLLLCSGRSRFSLATLPATDFPRSDDNKPQIEFAITQNDFRALVERTHFAMAQQDVRYYLNGMLLELNQGVIRSVATDGHRLAMNSIEASTVNTHFQQVIVPRKGITELMRLMTGGDADAEVNVGLSANHICVTTPSFVFTSKLIDGRFPDYNKVIPKGGDKTLILDRGALKSALSCVAVLSNEKFRGVHFQLRPGVLRLMASNLEHEEGEEEMAVDYDGDALDIGFNVVYLLDILSVVKSEKVKLILSDSNSSVLIGEQDGNGDSLFVVMPMRL